MYIFRYCYRKNTAFEPKELINLRNLWPELCANAQNCRLRQFYVTLRQVSEQYSSSAMCCIKYSLNYVQKQIMCNFWCSIAARCREGSWHPKSLTIHCEQFFSHFRNNTVVRPLYFALCAKNTLLFVQMSLYMRPTGWIIVLSTSVASPVF